VSPPRRGACRVVRWTMSDCRDQLEFSTSVVHTVLFASTLPRYRASPVFYPTLDLRSYMRHANVNEILPTCSRKSCTSELSSSRGRAKVIITSQNRNLKRSFRGFRLEHATRQVCPARGQRAVTDPPYTLMMPGGVPLATCALPVGMFYLLTYLLAARERRSAS
jgi:hypothetical protein